MTIHDIRRHNLRALIGTMKIAQFARLTGTNPDYLSQILSTKTKANVGSNLARQIETHQGLPKGWMDERHDDLPPPDDPIADLLKDYTALPPGLQRHICRKTAELRAYADALPPFLRAALVPPSDDDEHYLSWEREMEADMAARRATTRMLSAAEPQPPYEAPSPVRRTLRKGHS